MITRVLLLLTFGLGAVTGDALAQIVRSPEAKLQYHRAERAWRTGSSLAEAVARLDQVIASNPADAEAYLLRARVWLDLEEPNRALEDARFAVELAPEHGEAHLALTEAARRTGELREAMDALGVAADLLEGGAEAHVRLSWNALLLGELEKAEAFARVALALDERLPAAYRQMALTFLEQGQTEDAAIVLARGLRQGVVTPRMLESDPQLAELLDHALIRAALNDGRQG